MDTTTDKSLDIRDRYDLPDSFLLEPHGVDRDMVFWVPSRTLIVIGNGSDAESELHWNAVQKDMIPVIRRASGGCAVLLSPKMAVVALAGYTEHQLGSREYFGKFNSVIIGALENLGVSNLSWQGMSDIALGRKKIAGTALYRNKRLVFYHAIINLAEETSLMERYLKHPPREPEYRQGRRHSDFVTSLEAEGFEIDPNELRDECTRVWNETEF